MNRIVLLGLLLLTSCLKIYERHDDIKVAQAGLYPKLFSGINFAIPENSIVNKESLKKFPPLTWVPVIAWQNIEVEGKSPITYCAYYLVPKLDGNFKRKGVLKFIRVTDRKDCEGVFVRDAFAVYRDLTSLSVKITGGNNIKSSTEYYSLEITGEGSSKFKHVYPLYNLERGTLNFDIPLRKYTLEKFSSPYPATKLLGARPRYWGATGEVSSRKSNFMLGNMSDNFIDHTSVLCHEVDSDCREKKPFFCDQCKYGWIEVTGPNCGRTGNSKYCAPIKCGEKGYPACHRGFAYNSKSKNNGCIDSSISAFCKKGLIPFCNEKNKLICR